MRHERLPGTRSDAAGAPPFTRAPTGLLAAIVIAGGAACGGPDAGSDGTDEADWEGEVALAPGIDAEELRSRVEQFAPVEITFEPPSSMRASAGP